VYLLSAVVLSFIIPFLHFEWHTRSQQVPAAFKLLQVLPGNANEHDIIHQSSWLAYKDLIALAVYAIVSLFVLCMLVAKVAWVYRLKRKSEITEMHRFDFVHTQNDRAPFTFLNNLFWRDDINIESYSGKLILQHELTHIRQRHTYDKLFMQLAVASCWFNPCYWLIQKELSLVHEFIADENAITDNDTEAFARMLLQTHYGNQFPDIIHPFFYSSIKRRLIMQNQLKQTGFSSLRKLMALPVIATTLLLFSFKVNNTKIVRANKTIVLALDAGHGGDDNGAIGLDGVKEKDLVLNITNRLSQMGEEYNVKVTTIRTEDKLVSLQDRAEKANTLSADMLVSIHVNGSMGNHSRFNGFDIMVANKNSKYAESRILGSAIANQLKTMQIQSRMLDKSLHILRNVNMPAVLIECGYVDNATDIARINNNAELDKLCRNILNGIVICQNTAGK
jgi:N-acetylmuramoyl-L-alanine amidase